MMQAEGRRTSPRIARCLSRYARSHYPLLYPLSGRGFATTVVHEYLTSAEVMLKQCICNFGPDIMSASYSHGLATTPQRTAGRTTFSS